LPRLPRVVAGRRVRDGPEPERRTLPDMQGVQERTEDESVTSEMSAIDVDQLAEMLTRYELRDVVIHNCQTCRLLGAGPANYYIPKPVHIASPPPPKRKAKGVRPPPRVQCECGKRLVAGRCVPCERIDAEYRRAVTR
jgi:hypothetical protein